MAVKGTVNLKDYNGNIKSFDITLPSAHRDQLTIIYTKQVGDEVVYIFLFGNELYKLDSDNEIRTFDILDEIKPISLEELLALNKVEE